MADELYASLSCLGCSEEIVPVKKAGRPRRKCEACSPSQAGRVTPLPQSRKICAATGCSSTFITAYGHKRFCSTACLVKTSNRDKQVAARDRSERTCAGCPTAFTPAYGDLRRAYCSEACRISLVYKTRPGSTHRRRAKRFGCEFESFDKRLVFERDGWRCQICGVDTPERLSGTLKQNAPQLDHIVPLEARGPHTPANTQCACRRCNLKKSNGPAAGQIGLFTSLLNEAIPTRRRTPRIKPPEPAHVAGFAFLEHSCPKSNAPTPPLR